MEIQGLEKHAYGCNCAQTYQDIEFGCQNQLQVHCPRSLSMFAWRFTYFLYGKYHVGQFHSSHPV